MSLRSGRYGIDLGSPVEFSAPFRAQMEHEGLSVPEVFTNHPLDKLLLETEQTVAIDEVSLHDGLAELKLVEPTKIALQTDWQDSRSKSQLWSIEPAEGYYGTVHQDGQALFIPTSAYAAVVKIGVQPKIEKNEQLANRAFWTGVIACQELIQGNGAEEQLTREVEKANSKHNNTALKLVPGFVFTDIIVNTYITKALGITTYDYAQYFGVAAVTGLVLAPAFLYLKVKIDERPGVTEADYVTKKYKKQARDLAAEFPVIQIQSNA